MYLVGGLRGGGWAVVGQAHHALVDGIAAVEVADAALRRGRPSPGALHAGALGAGRAAVDAGRHGGLHAQPAGGRRARRARHRRHHGPRRRPPRRRAPARDAGARDRAGPLGHQPPRGGLRGHVAAGRPRGGPPPRRDDQRRPARRLHARPRSRAAPAAASGRPRSRCSCRSTCAAAARPPAMGNRISFVTVSLPVALTDPIDDPAARRMPRPRRARAAAPPRRWRRWRSSPS